MRLSLVTLRNWKTHRRFRLEVPFHNDRPVVLLEGNNGSGKTSILEAIVLGLYGRAGLPMVARANSTTRQDRSYERFMERALNAKARTGRSQISIELGFVTDEDEILIERVWHFKDGLLQRDDEEARVYTGADREVVPLPDPKEEERFLKDFIAHHVLPENLAGFFMLDGEHLERMASANVNGQVKAALDAAMGVDQLRLVAADLRSYARERRRQLPEDSAAAEAASLALTNLERDIESRTESADRLLSEIIPLRQQREDVVGQIGSLHGDSYRAFKEHFEDRERISRDRDAMREDLRRLLSGDLAQALSGANVRRAAISRIQMEDASERKRLGEAQNLSRTEEFLERFNRRVAADNEVKGAIIEAWQEMWTRAGPLEAERVFSHLGESDRRAVAEHLDRLGSISATQIRDIAHAVSAADDRIAALDRGLASQRGLDEESRLLAARLETLQSELSRTEGDHAREMATLEELRERHAKATEHLATATAAGFNHSAAAERTRQAERYADLIEDFSLQASPENLHDLSEAISTAYRSMAQKSVVERVEVNEDGKVALLDIDGLDLQELDASAGESHIFALSLMSALASMAADFPIIMDSPFARLDVVHRRKVIEHFSGLGRQLVLLVHPAELRPEELDLIESRSSGKILLASQDTRTMSAGATA